MHREISLTAVLIEHFQLGEWLHVEHWWASSTIQGTLGWEFKPDQSGLITITTRPPVVVISQRPTFFSVTSPPCYCSVCQCTRHRQHLRLKLPLSNGAPGRKKSTPYVASFREHTWNKTGSLVLAISGTSVRNRFNSASAVLSTSLFVFRVSVGVKGYYA